MWCTGLWQHGQGSVWTHVSLGTEVWTLKSVSCGGHIAERSSPGGKMGSRAAPLPHSAPHQLLWQQDISHLTRMQPSLQGYLMMLSLSLVPW